MSDLDIWLPDLQRWYQETKNPLYVWEAVSRCLSAAVPIPAWCLPYLAEASHNLTMLGWGRDFRDETGKCTVTPDKAQKLTGPALNLWRARTKSAFAKIADDGRAMRAARDYDHGREAVQNRLGLGEDRAARIVRRGRALFGRKR